MSKNIVLFADGTGNSPATLFKTNVWRMYQALDIRDSCEPRQIAFYDNGVGTESYKPLAAIGGAFGIGVWHNVRDLYTFVCRNYDAARHDKIFVFGFSRGAFTARLLVGLIGKCGIVKAQGEADLLRDVEMAYIEYRHDFLLRASESRHLIYRYFVREPVYERPKGDDKAYRRSRIHLPAEQEWPDVDFIGVWDTVDAYGMPVDELKHGLDRWIWPMSVADRQLSDHVLCARHALSLDDQRPTFRPVLWSEKTLDGAEMPHPERIKQVWFAGVHADVGGGYPDDAMAHVTLDWMMGEAEAAGLAFAPSARDQVQCRADAHGEQHDSRSGLAGYYRYGPRDVRRLCQDADNTVFVDRPRFHRSVLERIGRRQVDYSPVSLPRELLQPNAWMPDPANPYVLWPSTPIGGPQGGASAQADWLDSAWDAVWWRRLAYLSTVLLSAVLVLFPLLSKWNVLPGTSLVPGRIEGSLTRALGGAGDGKLLDFVLGWTPAWTHPWVTALLGHWPFAIVLIVLLAWLFFRASADLQNKIDARAEAGWASIKQVAINRGWPQSWTDRMARALRTSPRAVAIYRWISRSLIPFLFAWTVGLVVFLGVMIKLAADGIKRRTWLPLGKSHYVRPAT